MARKLILENLMKLAQGIGANPSKFMGTKGNITFLGKGPQKNPLFQRYLPGLENATTKNLGSRAALIEATEDAMGFASAGKLNDIQLKILSENLTGINKILNPPPLPMATISKFPTRGTGITSTQPYKSVLPEPGPGDIEGFKLGMTMQTGQSRSIAREILLKDTRLNLPDDVISSLRSKYDLAKGADQKWDPLELMKKYYGKSMTNYDDFLNSVNLNISTPGEYADMVLKHIKLTPSLTFAGGGLAEILQVPRSGYSKGRLVKGALAILNRNKKNADYMFKASDNVSPGYAAGDLKYNAELLADQLADDAGVVFADLDSISQTKFYGTAYDYLAKQMGQILRAQKIAQKNLVDLEQRMVLSDFNIKGRKPSASGGLARILGL